MSISKVIVCFVLVFKIYGCNAQNTSTYTPVEMEYANLFNAFRNHLDSCISQDVNILDTIEMKAVLLKYLYSNARLDSFNTRQFKKNELTDKQMKSFKEQFI